MRIRQSALLIVAAALAAAAPAEAQHCFRPRPLPACKSFFITEYSVGGTIGSGARAGDLYFSGELGWMSNVAKRSAIGGSLQYYGLGDGNGGMRHGFKSRYRRWLTETTSVDFAAGLLWGERVRAPGFTGHAAVNFGSLGVGIQVEAFTGYVFPSKRLIRPVDDPTSSGVDWYLMGRLGSKDGVVATLLTVLVSPIVYYVMALAAS